MDNILNIREEFGKFTGLRHCSISQKSGEEFYHTLLNERFKRCLETNRILIVDLDGNRGYSPSFVDESFGNLVFDFGLTNVINHLKVKSDNFKYWENSVVKTTFPFWEQKRLQNEFPIKTKVHKPWWRLQNGVLTSNLWITP